MAGTKTVILGGMRLGTKILLGALGLAVLAVGGFALLYRKSLVRQWHCYRVASAETFAAAREEMAWFLEGPDARDRLGELVAKWGTGSPQFDCYLARHVADPGSSELLREVFFREFQRRPSLVKMWAHYWAFQAPAKPADELVSLVAYFDIQAKASASITWREALELAALFHWSGRDDLIKKLEPTNWIDYYQNWQTTRPEQLPTIKRPAEALPLERMSG